MSQEKHHVMAFARMNPITSGHEKVVNKVHEVAAEHNAGHSVILSHSHDAKKNPLSPEQKVKHAKNAFPGTNISAGSKEKPNHLAHASDLHKQGVTHLHVVAGSDRVEATHKLLHDYNGKSGPHGHYNFKSITVHSSGERDPDSEGSEGISASKMREHAASGNKKEFHKGAPKSMSTSHKDAMYKDVRKGMGLHEDVSSIPPKNVQKKTYRDMVRNMTKRNGPEKDPEVALDKKEKQAMEQKVHENAPVAPVLDRKYIKGTPEWKAHKEKSKPINGHPTKTNVKEETAKKEKEEIIPTHRIMVVCSEPDHKHQSKREPTERFIKTTAKTKALAVLNGKRYFKKMGFKVHDAKHLHIISEDLEEHLDPKNGAGSYINDFIKSTNPRFVNKSKEERRRMAIGAYMAAKKKYSMNEESGEHELGIHHDEPISRHPHIKEVLERHGAKHNGHSDKATYFKFPSAEHARSAKQQLHMAGVRPDHWVNGEHINEEADKQPSNARRFKFFKGQEHIVGPKDKDGQKTVKEGVEQITGDDSIPTYSAGEDGESQRKKKGFRTSLVKISKNSIGRETEEGWEKPKIKGTTKMREETEEQAADHNKRLKRFKDMAKQGELLPKSIKEANHREFASQGKMHPDMAKHMTVGQHMDYYEPKTGDKVHGKVIHNNGKEVHVRQSHDSYDSKKVGNVHKFEVSNKLDEEQIDELSKSTLGSYAKKASYDATIKRKIGGDFEHMADKSRKPDYKDAATRQADKWKDMARKRKAGVEKAIDRLTKEEVELDESGYKGDGKVVTNKYSWGTMKHVEHGNDFSIPLHPEHHKAIAKLEDGQEHHFKDETGKHWGAYRRGDDVHFKSADFHGSMKTKVPHHTMHEE
jgi:hypothetical protein